MPSHKTGHLLRHKSSHAEFPYYGSRVSFLLYRVFRIFTKSSFPYFTKSSFTKSCSRTANLQLLCGAATSVFGDLPHLVTSVLGRISNNFTKIKFLYILLNRVMLNFRTTAPVSTFTKSSHVEIPYYTAPVSAFYYIEFY